MLFNLCSERQYKSSKFDAGVACFPFEDHQVFENRDSAVPNFLHIPCNLLAE